MSCHRTVARSDVNVGLLAAPSPWLTVVCWFLLRRWCERPLPSLT